MLITGNQLGNLTHLKSLDCSYSSILNEGIFNLIDNSPNLRDLIIHNCENLRLDEIIEFAIKNVTKYRANNVTLNLGTTDFFKDFNKSLPRLLKLYKIHEYRPLVKQNLMTTFDPEWDCVLGAQELRSF